MNKSYLNIADKISEDARNWIKQFEIIAPAEMQKRKKNTYKAKNIIITVLSIFIKPKFSDGKYLYIFQGIKNSEYMKIFNPESVVVVGSNLERDFAKIHGYNFYWASPIERAIYFKIYKNWNFFIIKQIKYWIEVLFKYEKIIIFLCEDTQPIGCYFVNIGKILKSSVTSVCIQHGYFHNQSHRCDGVLSDVNFVWELNQVSVIGCNRSKSFEIGLPYVATAKSTSKLVVVLVGVGTSGEDMEEYEKSIDAYSQIYTVLRNSTDLNIFYRPHPSEWSNETIISNLRKRLPNLDDIDKVARLNGSKVIFIGTWSSLLYEAGVAGHFVVYLKLNTELRPDFKYDLSFEYANINNLIKWIWHIESYKLTVAETNNVNQISPLGRFYRALQSAKLIFNGNIKYHNHN
jgi:hypothetical protein